MDKRFKVLMLNGSPRENGNIAIGFREMQKIFDELNVEYECINLGKKDVRGCIACGTCGNTGKCVFKMRSPKSSKKLTVLLSALPFTTAVPTELWFLLCRESFTALILKSE